MNILFLSTNFETGGVAIVTAFLADELKKVGHRTSIVVFHEPISNVVREQMDKSIPVYCLGKYACDNERVKRLRDILIQEHVDVVVNQYGLPWIPAKTLKKAKRGLNIAIISAYHSDPSANARLTNLDKQIKNNKNFLKKVLLYMEWWAFRFITGCSMRYVHHVSDAYVLLSPRFFPKFLKFTGLKDTGKMVAIPNPVTLKNTEKCELQKKYNTVIYVGRVETLVKRTDRVIDVWSKVEKKHPDWNLKIVGDGDGLAAIRQKAIELKLKNISFEGFQNPIRYYQEAKLELLTSDFEGFGLVLVEGMMFGVVPIAYGSYDSIFDIIEDGENGFVVLPEKDNFSVERMAERLEYLMNSDNERIRMSYNSQEIGKKFSKENIINMWVNLLEKVSETRIN